MSQVMKTALPLLLLSAVAVFSTWYLYRLESDLYAHDSSVTLAPRLMGDDVEITSLNEEGGAVYRIQVARAVQGPGESGVDLVRPHMVFFDDGVAELTVRSDRGWLSDDRKFLRLLQAVRVEGMGAAQASQPTLTTEYLEIYPEKEIAVTPRPVRISMPGHVVDAIGMRVDLARSHIELKAQVRGQHEFASN